MSNKALALVMVYGLLGCIVLVQSINSKFEQELKVCAEELFK